MRRLLCLLALLLLPAAVPAQGNAPFPHAKHSRLFPTCSGCHAGIATMDSARFFPAPALCATCHDGTVKPRVAWSRPPSRGAGLLVFSHQRHSVRAANADCESCHATSGRAQWMNVSRATPERCTSCHTHGATAHLDERNTCSTCHRTLASAVALTDSRIAGFPKPPSHAAADFASAHGGIARASSASCATCHSRESCQRCHVDGARQPLIRALGTDARIARLVSNRPASYPTPADHRTPRFALMHGAAARGNLARCATCHARASCESCHTGEGARELLRRIPDAREATAPGVQLRRALTSQPLEVALAGAPVTRQAQGYSAPGPDTALHVVRVHPAGFARSHGPAAASGVQQCASCHSQRTCQSCHASERTTRRYHPANFVSTHAPQAYSRETECSSCHSTESFCRDCHRQTGLTAKGNLRSAVFHNAQPLWLLQHGRAARQDLKSCATCHQQTYCMQCHSDLGSRVNPHGKDFDAARMSARNPALCLYCHLTNPLTR